MHFYIAELSKQSDSKLEKFVSPSVLKEEENRERTKWICPRCRVEQFVGKDCSLCRKGLYDYDDYEKTHDLLKQLVAEEEKVDPKQEPDFQQKVSNK